MKKWKVAPNLSDLVQPQEALQRLRGVPFEITLDKGRNDFYRGETIFLSADGLAHRAFLELTSVGDHLIISYERLPLAQVEQGGTTLDDVAKIFLQYRQTPAGIEVLGLSSESCINIQKVVAEVPVPFIVPAKARVRKIGSASRELALGAVDSLLESDPRLYLAHGIEARLRKERYDGKIFRFAVSEKKYDISDYLSNMEAAPLLNITRSALYQRILQSGNPLIKYRDKPSLVQVEDLICMAMIEISPSKKKYDEIEIASFFGVSTNDIAFLLQRNYFTIPPKTPATAVKIRFRESFDLVMGALREGKSLLEHSAARPDTPAVLCCIILRL